MSGGCEIVRNFTAKLEEAEANLRNALELVTIGRAPTTEQIAVLSTSVTGLRESYDVLRSAALDGQDTAGEELPADSYVQMLEERRRIDSLRERYDYVMHVLALFETVKSDVEAFDEAIAPYRRETTDALARLSAIDDFSIPDSYSEMLIPRELFINAVKCDTLDSDEGLDLLDKMGDAYPLKVHQGLMFNRYYLSEGDEVPHDDKLADEAAPVVDEAKYIPERPVAVPDDIDYDRPIIEDDSGDANTDDVTLEALDDSSGHIEQDVVNDEVNLDEYLVPSQTPRSPKNVNVSTWRKELGNSAPKSIRISLPTLAFFECLSAEQLETIAGYMSRGRDGSGDIRKSIGYMQRKGLAIPYEVDGETVYCMSSLACQLISKNGIKNLKNGRLPFWGMTFREDCKGFDDQLSRSFLKRRLARNRLFAEFAEAVDSLHRERRMGPVSHTVSFDDEDVMTVHLKWEGTDYACTLLSAGELPPDDVENIVIVTDGEDGLQISLDEGFGGMVFIVRDGTIHEAELKEIQEGEPSSHANGIESPTDETIPDLGPADDQPFDGEAEDNPTDNPEPPVEEGSSELPVAEMTLANATILRDSRETDGNSDGDELSMAGDETISGEIGTQLEDLTESDGSPLEVLKIDESIEGQEFVADLPEDSATENDHHQQPSESNGDDSDSEGRADTMSMDLPSAERAEEICKGILEGTFGKWDDSTFSDRAGVALAFAKALTHCDGSTDTEGLFLKLLMASDSSIAPHEYTLDQIRDAFRDPRQDDLGQVLLLSTYLRAMLAPEKPYDHDLWSAFDFYADNYEEYFGAYPETKSLFMEMQGIHLISKEHGFTAAVVDRLSERARNKDRLQEICTSARELTQVRKVKNQIIGVHEFHEAAFGEQSELGKAMAVIAGNDEGSLPEVSALAHRYAGDDILASKPDIDAIENDITQTWKEKVVPRAIKHKHKGNRDLDFAARNTARDEYIKRVEVMCAWVSYKESRDSDEVLKTMGKKRLSILSACEQALESLSVAQPRCCIEFLTWVIRDISEKLQGTSVGLVRYDDFLRTGLISLTDEMLPMLEETESKVAHFEPWRRILAHVDQRDISLQDAYDHMQSKDYTGDNLRQMQQLRQVLGLKAIGPREFERAVELAAKEADAKLSQLKDDLEIWFAYGRIDDDQRETIAAMADDLREPMYDVANFDLWHMMLRALRMIADDWSSMQYQELRDRCDSAQTHLRDHEKSPLLEEARKLLEDERNYAVVEDYLNRFEAGERNLTRQDTDDEEDEFVRFMTDEVFQPLYERAVAGKSSTNRFKTTAKNLVAERHADDWTEEQFANAEQLIMSWPSNRGYRTTQLRDLFTSLGFNATYGEKVKATDLNVEHYRVHITPIARSLQSYSHPIAAFGTQAVESIDVVVTYENASPQTIVQLVSSLRANEAVAVLVDYHLDRASRRKVAELYMKMASRPTKFLLIDRVLLMHLAQAQLGERLAMLLKCTLPLTYLQPFTNGAGPTADEMFCGRVTELDAIMNFNGACIIYGGRQLGKTALLERAASLVNDPSNRQLAIKVSIKGLSDESIVVQKVSQELNRELRRVKKSLASIRCSTMSELCQKIDELFESGDISRVLLLLDETDYFLAAISGDEYAQLEPLDELRLRRPGSFKFVLAGLHNVVRATRNTKNVIFGRLGEPICIKPLPPRDALRLLRRPLLYLGYHVDYPNVETILTNTNYYPGLVQFFGNKLVESMSTHFGVYYSAARSNPPYLLKEQQLASIFTDYDINVAIREKFMLTLELDERDRYMLIAQIIAALYYDRKQSGRPTNEGFTLQEIKGFADDWHFSKLALETADTFMALLDELCEMGVLAHVGADRDHYRIRRSTFLGYIGSEEDIWDAFGKEELDEE